VHHVGILYDQFMMHGQRNIKSSIMYTQPLDRCHLPSKYAFSR